MNDLQSYFLNNKGRVINKWEHYFDIYDRYFNKYREQPNVVILEIGVANGGSIEMWKNYFGPNAKIFGIDINPECKKFESENVKIFIGSQSDKIFLNQVKQSIPQLDILIDDGGHSMSQQITTFEVMFEHVKNDGIFLCEDVHTSYWLPYGGGYKRSGTFIEYTKNLIDSLYGFHSKQNSLKITDFTKSTNSIHFYDSIVVIEKKRREKPVDLCTGTISLSTKPSNKKGPIDLCIKGFLFGTNYVLRFLRIKGFIWK
ncbi:class I SAM-dependent methyltransferase [Aquirufa sp. KTFRIE-69F]|uniref:Class I SAM-dependent methyltransferase n=1 Tax=Aquirufa originis TaxID=3096514 RepID=A0ABW6D970_9BACT